MMNAETALYSRKGERIQPSLVGHGDEELLELVAALLTLFSGAIGSRRAELEEDCASLCLAFRRPQVAKGLAKLCLDRTVFTAAAAGQDWAELRHRLFSAAQSCRASGSQLEPQTLHAAVAAQVPEAAALLADPYADLPDNDTVAAFEALPPRELLERYNLGQVQYLLLHALEMRLIVNEAEPAALRRLLRYLRFFRLLADVERTGPDALLITVSGPLAVLENTRKYGLQMASFFGAVPLLPRYRLDATIKIDGRSSRLSLDESSRLSSHYRHQHAFVPEELRLFRAECTRRDGAWTLDEQDHWLSSSAQRLIFPDLSFRHADGRLRHLELFHRWHSGPLLQRLEELAAQPALPLLLGVDRALLTAVGGEQALLAHPGFAGRGFLFRDYPTVLRTTQILETWTPPPAK